MPEDQSPEATEAEFLVYEGAWEECALWELTWPVEGHREEGRVVVRRPYSRDELAPALLAALERGDVSLYEHVFKDGRGKKRDLTHDEALEVIHDAAYWALQTAPMRISLYITDAGEERNYTMKTPEFERRPKL